MGFWRRCGSGGIRRESAGDDVTKGGWRHRKWRHRKWRHGKWPQEMTSQEMTSQEMMSRGMASRIRDPQDRVRDPPPPSCFLSLFLHLTSYTMFSLLLSHSYAFSLTFLYLSSSLLTLLIYVFAPSVAFSASRYGTRGVIRWHAKIRGKQEEII